MENTTEAKIYTVINELGKKIQAENDNEILKVALEVANKFRLADGLLERGEGANTGMFMKPAAQKMGWLAQNAVELPEFAELKVIFAEMKAKFAALKAAR